MKIWIPGVKGLVGSYLTSILQVPFVGSGREIDISNESSVRAFVEEKGPFTQIINCAAFSTVDPAESMREEAFRSNALGPEVLGRVAQEKKIRLLHLSTDYVLMEQEKGSKKRIRPLLAIIMVSQNLMGRSAFLLCILKRRFCAHLGFMEWEGKLCCKARWIAPDGS